jgi:hypothetical protein
MGNTYVIYYGWLIDDPAGRPSRDAQQIAAAKVPLLIAEFFTVEPRFTNMSPQVLALMKNAGTDVFAYVSTRWGDADLAEVKELTSERLAGGVDGIFFDEAPSSLNSTTRSYYKTLSKLVRDQGKSVIFNPGVSQCEEELMQFADRIMAEHEWRKLVADSAWTSGYPDDRFMGVSSNVLDERGRLPMGYEVDEEHAIADTREAWELGVGWHTSTDLHVNLPEWFDAYMEEVNT